MIAQTASRSPAPARSVTARMADFITSLAASAGNVTREDLLLDFTDEEIDGNFEAAKRMARNAGNVTREDLLLDFTDEEIDGNFEAAKRMARNAGKVRQ